MDPMTRSREPDAAYADALLARHRMYLPLLDGLLGTLPVHGMAHITGGGIPENLPRALRPGLRARVDRGSWEIPSLFRALQRLGKVEEAEMFDVFNMGIGYVLVVPADAEEDWLKGLRERGDRPVRLGYVEEGERSVVWAD